MKKSTNFSEILIKLCRDMASIIDVHWCHTPTINGRERNYSVSHSYEVQFTIAHS